MINTLTPEQMHSHAQALAELDLPRTIIANCGQKTQADLAKLRLRGAASAALGVIRAYHPDQSAEAIEEAYRSGLTMHTPAYETLAFEERLTDPERARGRVKIDGVDISQETTNEGSRVIVKASNAPSDGMSIAEKALSGKEWQLPLPGQKVAFGNHVAALLCGQVINPGQQTNSILSLPEWKESLKFNEAVIITGHLDPYNPSLRIHTELMPNAQRRDLGRILGRHSIDLTQSEMRQKAITLPNKTSMQVAILTPFLNLQLANRTLEAMTDAEKYAYHVTGRILDWRNAYKIPQTRDAQEQRVQEVIQLLRPLTLYQRWLEQTDKGAMKN